MVPAQVLSRILAVQPVLDALERDQAAPRTAFEHLAIGQAVTGLVKSQVKDISLVLIDGHTVAMRLPRRVETGDTLKLSFAGHMPQPVFLLETPETAASDAPQLSQTARLLSDIMQRVPDRTLPTLTPPAPLLGQPPAHPAELALALRTAVVRSGLFYESHLANWAVGQDSLDGLMQEPQNRLAATDPTRAAPALAVSTPDQPEAGGAAEAKTANPLHALLTQQLQVLESPQFAWHGEVWPGQALAWQIGRETDPLTDGSASHAAPEANAGWESRLKLTLPQLGTVTVHIRLDERQAFSIRMVPERHEVEPLLQKNQARLVEQLAAAGCSLQSLMVQTDAGA